MNKELSELISLFKLPYDLYPWQKELLIDISLKLKDIAKHPDKDVIHQYQLIGAFGVGKTTLLSIVIIQYMLFSAHHFPDDTFKCVVVSGTEKQLKRVMWNDLKNIILGSSFASQFILTGNTITIVGYPKIMCTICIVPPSAGSKIAGIHANNVLVIFDEGTAIPDYMYEKVETFFTNCRGFWLVSGNGERTDGMFYKNYNERHDNHWNNIQVSRFDLGIENDIYTKLILNQHGEDSDEYRVNVLGHFTERSQASLFPEYLIKSALSRWTGTPSADLLMGIDVSSGHGADYSIVLIRTMYSIHKIYKVKMPTDEFIMFVRDKINTYRPQAVAIDEIGYGNGVYTSLASLYKHSLMIVPVKGGEKDSKGIYLNKRTELYHEARDFMKYGSIPNNQDLIDELRTITVTKSERTCRVQLDAKKNNKKSPDIADAFAYSMAIDFVSNVPNMRINKNIRNYSRYR